ncbi:hypothetical protein [Saccharopolyspora shandongensis]|uniref:hypothetical protein n=1 Tax=Saccharopolyspora shandongensis TaxID=418495 RepID=UPI0033E7BDB5
MRLGRCAVVFDPGDPPRAGAFVVHDPGGGPLPVDLTLGEPAEPVVTLAEDGAVVARRVPARRIAVAQALPLLVAMRDEREAHPSAGFHSAAAVLALHLVARGRVLPGVSPDGVDAWRRRTSRYT